MCSKIKTLYRKYEHDRIHQGDLLTDVDVPIILYSNEEPTLDIITFQYGLVLSQDCDLEGAKWLHLSIQKKGHFDEEDPIKGNSFLPSIIIAPAFIADNVRVGDYLSPLGFKMVHKGRSDSTTWSKIESNNDPRYHFIGEFKDDLKIPPLVVDFKIFYTVPYEYIYAEYGHDTIYSLNELFREDLSQRFFNFHSRIGLPLLEEDSNCEEL